MSRALEDLLSGPLPKDLASQLAWLERAAESASSAAAELGESADRAALDLRASLGAFVQFARGSQSEADRIALELTVRSLLMRALHTLYGALADQYLALGKANTALDPECRELARLWSTLQKRVAKGQPMPPDLAEKLAAIRVRMEAKLERG